MLGAIGAIGYAVHLDLAVDHHRAEVALVLGERGVEQQLALVVRQVEHMTQHVDIAHEQHALAERRIAMLIDANLSNGLPAFLVAHGGLNSGFMAAQVTAAALASENKSLAHPASVDSLPTSANQEDHVSMATYGARRLLDMVRNAAVMVGIEAMSAAQGMEFDRSLKSSPLVEEQFAAIRRRVAFLEQDRYLAPDIEAMRAWAQQSSWPAPLLACMPSHE